MSDNGRLPYSMFNLPFGQVHVLQEFNALPLIGSPFAEKVLALLRTESSGGDGGDEDEKQPYNELMSSAPTDGGAALPNRAYGKIDFASCGNFFGWIYV
jgi:hypothetical protein